ncbi:MAG: LysR family transcriptional regulator [Rhodospirillales bacterium]|nr:LysR family transcriptional regulator [Rhodospirillales bacterium]
MDWGDLRYVLAIARAGSLSGAARELGVNHSTVFRRLSAFEARLGVRLFDRLATGYALTVAGADMLASLEKIDQEINALDRRLSGRDLKLSGPVVVTTTNTLAYRFLGPHLAAFQDKFPGINLELVLATEYFSLSKRQADVAIRPTTTPPDTLVGRRLCAIAFALYASEQYLKTQGHARDLADHRWLGFDDNLSHLAAAQWMREKLPDARFALRSNNLLGLFSGAVAGMGVAPLPCFMGDTEPNLKRLFPPDPKMGSELWLLTHEDLRHTARIRAFMDFMATSIIADKNLLEGRRPN